LEKAIRTKDLTFEYHNESAVKNELTLKSVNLSVESGEFVAILGHNGSGKSTLAKHFNAILLPSGGSVYINGIDTKIEEKLFEIRQKVGMVFQNPDNQIVATIVEEDVAFALENIGLPPSEIRNRVDEALKIVGMYEYKDHAAHQLSGGQKQRIAIAGVIAMRPECIVLDEPTAMLDPRGRKEVISTIKMLNEKMNTTVVLITHFMDEAVGAKRVVVMSDGNLLLDGTPREIFSNVGLLKSIGLDVPQVTEFTFELRKMGYKVPFDILTNDECVEVIAKMMEEKNCL
jgi:energy-coupling factor transport system ATP-binding protein